MFDNIGWGEILVLIIIAVIVIGPERLPDLIKDVRAAAYAARKAINNARAELDGNFGEEFDELREPISKAAEWGRLGPRKAVTKALFDDDDSFLDDFDPKKMVGDSPTKPTSASRPARQAAPAEQDPLAARREQMIENAQRQQPSTRAQQPQPPQPPAPGAGDSKGDYGTGGGFSWADIT